MQRRHALMMLTAATVGSRNFLLVDSDTASPAKEWREHTAWVGAVLRKMLRIKPGMTRKELLTVFTTEGGISTRLWRIYVSRDCPYFKVEVNFRAVGKPGVQEDLPARSIDPDESVDDVIVKISRPYLQFSIMN